VIEKGFASIKEFVQLSCRNKAIRSVLDFSALVETFAP
jgi:hypothetical protein